MKQNKINEMLETTINKIELKITWRFVIYIIYILTTMFFVAHAFLHTYETWLAGLLWLLYIISYPFSIFLIRRVEE